MKSLFQISLAMLVLLMMFGCSLRPANMSADANGTTSMRNFLELTETMSVATGIPSSTNSVRNFFNGAKQRLSLDGSADAVSPSLLLAGTALAGIYCQEFINKEAGLVAEERRVHQAINFNQGPASVDSNTRRAVVNAYARLFWQRDAAEAEITTLLTAMSEAEAGVTNNGTELRNILRVACTAVGSSLDAIRN